MQSVWAGNVCNCRWVASLHNIRRSKKKQFIFQSDTQQLVSGARLFSFTTNTGDIETNRCLEKRKKGECKNRCFLKLNHLVWSPLFGLSVLHHGSVERSATGCLHFTHILSLTSQSLSLVLATFCTATSTSSPFLHLLQFTFTKTLAHRLKSIYHLRQFTSWINPVNENKTL